MTYGLGRVAVELAEPVGEIRPELVRLINENVNPPVPVTAADVYVRAMYVVSDEVNSYGGRFPAEELPRLVELLVDSPVMVGHRKDRLPIARNFHARIEERQGRPWVKSYFYWLRDAGGGDALRENIDGGVLKECSLGFTFGLPECSLCGKDIRECPHEPLTKTTHNGLVAVCHFNYRRLERVLETSLVYRGAVPNTAMTADLESSSPAPWLSASVGETAREISEPGELGEKDSFLMTPAYDGLLVTLEPTATDIELKTCDGRLLPSPVAERLKITGGLLDQPVGGILMACRGRERLPVRQLVRSLKDPAANGCHLELRLFPSASVGEGLLSVSGRDRIGLLRHRVVTADEVDRLGPTMQTRSGVHLWANRQQPWAGDVYSYCDSRPGGNSESYQLTMVGRDTAILALGYDQSQAYYRVFQFSPRRLQHGGRFVCDILSAADRPPVSESPSRLTGKIESVKTVGQGTLLELSGALAGTFVLQRIHLDGSPRYMFYRTGSGTATRS
ncbi:MAG: hypothetical protein ABIE70_04450 [bacterium]